MKRQKRINPALFIRQLNLFLGGWEHDVLYMYRQRGKIIQHLLHQTNSKWTILTYRQKVENCNFIEQQ